MMNNERDSKQEQPPQPKPASDDTVRREIEGVKRTLYNAIDKLERLQRRDAELTTT
jgi:hypothetical protein